MYTYSPNSSVTVKYAIVHITKGRIRVRIPKLKYDQEYRCRLEKLVKSWQFVTGVRINPAAQSIIIHYNEQILAKLKENSFYEGGIASTFKSFQTKLATAIQEAANLDLSVLTETEEAEGLDFEKNSKPCKPRVSLPSPPPIAELSSDLRSVNKARGDVSYPLNVGKSSLNNNKNSKEQICLSTKGNSDLDSNGLNLAKSTTKLVKSNSVELVSSANNQPKVNQLPIRAQVSKVKAKKVHSSQKTVVEKPDRSIKADERFCSPQFSTTQTKTYSSTSSTNTDKRFKIVFWQTRATSSPIRSIKQEKTVDYNRLSQQIQIIHRSGGKILSISVIN